MLVVYLENNMSKDRKWTLLQVQRTYLEANKKK